MVRKRKSRISKNRKLYWKKFSDVKDVEQHLEEEIKEEILGGPVRNKPNSELFFVDKEVETDQNKRQRQHWTSKPLRCHSILASFSQVPPPIRPNKHTSSKVKPKKEINGRRKKVVKVNEKLPSTNEQIGAYDIWDTPEPSISNGLMDNELENYYKIQLKKKGRSAPSLFFEKPSPLPAVEVARPGASYNPTHADHQRLLADAHQVELDKIKEEQRLARALDHKFPLLSQAPTQESWIKEMSQGIIELEEGAVESDEDVDCTAPLSLNPPVRADKRKPANKRRKERKLKLAAIAVEMEKRATLRANEVYRIRSLTAEVMEEKYESQARQLKRKLIKQSRAHLPAKLSRYKYESPEVELSLRSELTGSLRTMKAEGSVLHDRFKSFQRRNIIEPRIKQRMKRKYRLKTYFKRGYEDEAT